MSIGSRFQVAAFAVGLLCSIGAAAQSSGESADEQRGVPVTGAAGITESLDSIMARARADDARPARPPRLNYEFENEWRHPKPNPDAPEVSSWPPGDAGVPPPAGIRAPQTVSTPNFTGATLADTSAFPPDTMGAVGPTQFVVGVNGRIRTFNKTTGAADGVLNAGSDSFFSSVMTLPLATNFTSDPRVRYDRLTGRWFIIIIDVPNGGSDANRVLIAVSSGSTITAASNFTFYQFQMSTTQFADYPTLGIDANALYIGGNMFDLTTSGFLGTLGSVVRKSSVLSGGPIVTTTFTLLASSTSAGPFTPQGVDNYDPAATEGYFVGVDNASFSLLDVRRVSNPGGTPTISGPLTVTVPTTTFPNRVPHLGNTGGTNGQLDSLDDRLFAAHLRNGRLWTAHNIRVSTAGVASTATSARNAVRWYELGTLTTTPTLIQSGTVFDNAASNPIHHFIPSIMVSGQGHAVLGFSMAGNNLSPNAGTNGRLASDGSGITGAVVNYSNSTAAYNPASDPGGASGRRWGDYSYTSLDPCDDMTMWTIQEFADSANSYGVRAVRLLAPAPTATNCASVTDVQQGQSNVSVPLAGTGFFEPAANVGSCRILLGASASGSGVTIAPTFNSATSLSLSVSATAGATLGTRTITITNPDGQATGAATGCLNITAAPATTTITALTRVGSGAICAGQSLDWTATFAASVTGGATTNFQFNGGTGTAITGIAGSGATRTVSTNVGTAAGTLRLDMANSTGVSPAVSNVPFQGATVTVNANPTAFSVTGGGAFCTGGAGTAVGLSGSQTGFNYQLLRDGNPVGSPVAGTGAALAFGNQATAGTYTVTASNASAASCAATMTGSAVVTVNALPTSFNVTGGGAFCAGGAGPGVSLSGSQSGVNYQLLRDGNPVGSAVAGTGAALNFGNQATGGSYTVAATNATTSCAANMSGNATVTSNPLPTTFNVGGGGAFCAGGAGVGVSLSGSQAGINYQLLRDGNPVGGTVAGTGAALAFGNQTTGGSYTVTAANASTSCGATMTGNATVTSNPLPTAFSVTGGGSFCAGGAGVAVGLGGSQSGVNYQLLRDGNPVGSTLPGTGAALAFGNQTTGGSYTVSAANASTSCGAPMTGNASVAINPVPSLNSNSPAMLCTATATSITLASTPAGASFSYTASNSAGSVTGFGAGIANPIAQTLTGSGDVTYVVTPTLGSCPGSAGNVVQRVTNPVPAAAVLPNGVQTAAYSVQLTAPGALQSTTFTLAAGALPAGLTLSPAGLIGGTPTALGTSNFTVSGSDATILGCTATRSYSIEVVVDALFANGFE